MIKTDIIFTGYYGQLNTGDDAFVEVASWGANHYWRRHNNRFLAVKSKLPKTIIPVKGYPLTIPKSYRYQNKILLHNSSYLVSAGGSTIHSKMNSQNPKQIAVDIKKNGGKIKIGAIGVSIGPFNSIEDEKAVKSYLKSIDFIALRDRRSFEYAASLDLPYKPINAFDLAALLPEIYKHKFNTVNSSKQKIIGINICPYESIIDQNVENEKRRIQKMVHLIKILNKEDIYFKFLVINGHPKVGDKKLTKNIIATTGVKNYCIVDYTKNTKKMWIEVITCDLVMTTRLHGGIFACFAQTPFIQVEYHQKCSDFLEDIGYDENLRIFDFELEINEIAYKILGILNNKDNYKKPRYLSEMKEKSYLNFTETIKYF